MKTAINVALAFIVCLTGSNARADDSASDESRVQGMWTLSRGKTNGRPLSEALQRKGLGDLTIEISGNVMTMNFPGRASYKYKFTLKPKEHPKAIDFVTIETHGKAPQGTKVQGIYAIEDGKLKLCMPGGSSDKRPDEFESPKGSGLSLLILTRTDNGRGPT